MKTKFTLAFFFLTLAAFPDNPPPPPFGPPTDDPPLVPIDEWIPWLLGIVVVAAFIYFKYLKSTAPKSHNNTDFMKLKIRFLRPLFIFVLGLLLHTVTWAQIKNYGNLYIHDQTVFYVASDVYDFAATAVTQTSRGTMYGKLAFGAAATASAASNTHYVDGYVSTFATTAFIAPVGAGGIYAPARIVPSASSGVDVAYVRSSGSALGTAIDLSSLAQVSDTEYWIVKGASSTLSLSWRASSALTSMLLTPSINYITLVGYNGSQWVLIPSTVDTTSFLGGASSVTAGSITSDANVNLAGFTAFALGAKKELPCYPAIVSSGTTKTWNGSWSPSAPTIADPVVISTPFTGDLTAFSVALNADVTLADAHKMEVATGFSGTGKVVMASEASLLQRDGTAAAPTVVLTKKTRPMRRYDYVFLSSPINNTTAFFDHVLNKNNAAVTGDFGLQNLAAFEQLRTFDAAGLQAINATPQNTPLGRGFSATVRSQAPYSTSNAAGAWFDEKKIIHLKTEGIANNGPVQVALPTNGWVRIGNPYPSPINATRLLDALGPQVFQTLYYWTFNNPRGSLSANSYNNADFATFNRAGGTAVCAQCEVPSGVIATMQSVLAYTGTAGMLTMTNCLRDLSGNTNFYKVAATTAGHGKFRLNLVGSAASFSQILISYDSENGTLGYDNGFDAPRLSGTSSELSSLIGASRYVIQTRPSFTVTDMVPLLLDKRTTETFSITMATVEGVFETTPVYLHDKTLGVYHDLTTGGYSFVQAEANANRFEVVYQTPLAAPDFKGTGAFAFIHQSLFSAQAQTSIKHIALYDLAGRLTQEFKNISSTSFTSPFQYPQGVYIAKITLDTEKVVTQKLIHF